MLNVYLRLFAIAAIVLLALAILHVVIPLLITAAIVAAVVMGLLFLINLFRGTVSRKNAPPPAQYPR